MLQNISDKMRLFKHFFSSASHRGLKRTLQISFYEMWYERRFGMATGLVIPVARLDYSDDAKSHAEPYFPSSYLFLREAFVAGPIDCRGHVFVDYGCGMGRALLFASTLPFERIIGVELSPSLCLMAKENMESYYQKQNKTAPVWSVVNADARRFEVPDDATIFYFYNPFDASILSIVLDNILASICISPRTCYIVYANPIHEHLLKDRAFVKLQLHMSATDYVIYSSNEI